MSGIVKKEEPKNLPKEVAEKFNLIAGIGIGEMKFKGKTYHLDNITVDGVEKLIELGFKGFTPKKTATTTTKP